MRWREALAVGVGAGVIAFLLALPGIVADMLGRL